MNIMGYVGNSYMHALLWFAPKPLLHKQESFLVLGRNETAEVNQQGVGCAGMIQNYIQILNAAYLADVWGWR